VDTYGSKIGTIFCTNSPYLNYHFIIKLKFGSHTDSVTHIIGILNREMFLKLKTKTQCGQSHSCIYACLVFCVEWTMRSCPSSSVISNSSTEINHHEDNLHINHSMSDCNLHSRCNGSALLPHFCLSVQQKTKKLKFTETLEKQMLLSHLPSLPPTQYQSMCKIICNLFIHS
jgi:hypothetical protein